MLNYSEKREVKCSNICVGRGESQTYAVNQKFMSIGKEERRH